MSHGKVLDKQTLELAARILQNLPDISEKEKQYLIRNPSELKQRLLALRSELAIASHFGFTETALLRLIATGVASGDDILDEDAFFRCREGEIFVFDCFRKTFGSTFQKSRASEWLYVSCEVKYDEHCDNIQADLPKSHLSKLGDVARFIKAQQSGAESILLADGSLNNTFVEGKDGEIYWVCVYLDVDDSVWIVRHGRLDEAGGFAAGNRFICPCNVAI